VVQVRECAYRLVREAKARGTTVLLVGHVTKDGGLAGPRVLEHVVDTVLEFQGERHHALRLLRATKHRFGPTNELGLFEMAGVGCRVPGQPAVSGDRSIGVAGSAVAAYSRPAAPGRVQALVAVSARRVPPPPGLDQVVLASARCAEQRRRGRDATWPCGCRWCPPVDAAPTWRRAWPGLARPARRRSPPTWSWWASRPAGEFRGQPDASGVAEPPVWGPAHPAAGIAPHRTTGIDVAG
jgi:hypothetical protein